SGAVAVRGHGGASRSGARGAVSGTARGDAAGDAGRGGGAVRRAGRRAGAAALGARPGVGGAARRGAGAARAGGGAARAAARRRGPRDGRRAAPAADRRGDLRAAVALAWAVRRVPPGRGGGDRGGREGGPVRVDGARRGRAPPGPALPPRAAAAG